MQRSRIGERRQIEDDSIRFSPIGWISFMFPMHNAVSAIYGDCERYNYRQAVIHKRKVTSAKLSYTFIVINCVWQFVT